MPLEKKSVPIVYPEISYPVDDTLKWVTCESLIRDFVAEPSNQASHQIIDYSSRRLFIFGTLRFDVDTGFCSVSSHCVLSPIISQVINY